MSSVCIFQLREVAISYLWTDKKVQRVRGGKKRGAHFTSEISVFIYCNILDITGEKAVFRGLMFFIFALL